MKQKKAFQIEYQIFYAGAACPLSATDIVWAYDKKTVTRNFICHFHNYYSQVGEELMGLLVDKVTELVTTLAPVPESNPDELEKLKVWNHSLQRQNTQLLENQTKLDFENRIQRQIIQAYRNVKE